MTKAYSYLRFSTPEQERGDSTRRQTQLARDYATRHGLELDEELSFSDRGVSAYRGRNAKVGALAAFLESVDAGQVPEGSYLLVESLDRLSRDAILPAQGLFMSIISAGIILVTLMDGKEYSEASVNANPTDLIISLLTMMRAHEESATKARRLRAAWEGKRLTAKDKPLTARAPAWLHLDPTTRTFSIVEDRAAIVRRVFALALEGRGQNAIATVLNTENVPTFGGTKKRGKHWHRSYIIKLLYSPAVVGTFVPRTLEYAKGKKVRKPQPPVPGYFPAIVDEDTFQRVQSLRIDSRAPQRGRHAGREVRNLFGGLATCPLCGGSMTRVVKGAGRGKPRLVCSKAKVGAGCEYHSVPYDGLEQAFLSRARHIASHAPAGGASSIDEELATAEEQILTLEETIGRLLDELQSGRSAALSARVRALEDELDLARAARDAIGQKRATVRGPLLDRKLAELADISSKTTDLGAANLLLRQLLSAVVIDFHAGDLVLRWKHGGETAVAVASLDFA